MDIRILVVNLNNKEYTKNCINNLLSQTYENFKLTIVDQNSSEEGTQEFLETLTDSRINIVRNAENHPLNYVWNWFHQTYNEEILCFLNNDVIITDNFVYDTIEVFNKEPQVGIVVHSTNHENYTVKKTPTEYTIVEPGRNMQGWDYSIRRNLFVTIPEQLKTYCGDDFIFYNLYKQGYDLAYVTSSPMIHFEGQSKKFMKTSGIEDIHTYVEMGFPHNLRINEQFSKIRPSTIFL
jgi:GT2 family glycosyltransferase